MPDTEIEDARFAAHFKTSNLLEARDIRTVFEAIETRLNAWGRGSFLKSPWWTQHGEDDPIAWVVLGEPGTCHLSDLFFTPDLALSAIPDACLTDLVITPQPYHRLLRAATLVHEAAHTTAAGIGHSGGEFPTGNPFEQAMLCTTGLDVPAYRNAFRNPYVYELFAVCVWVTGRR